MGTTKRKNLTVDAFKGWIGKIVSSYRVFMIGNSITLPTDVLMIMKDSESKCGSYRLKHG